MSANNFFRGDRRRDFKTGINSDDSRRKREDSRLQIRKKNRQEQLQKRRMGNNKETVYEGNNAMGNDDPVLAEKLKELPRIVAGIRSNDPQVQYESVTAIRKMLSIERNPPIQQVIESGIIPRLVEFLKRTENPGLQFEASWALTNVASGTTENTTEIIKHGAIPIFVQLLESPSDDVREQAVWALGNVAGDSPDCRNMVLEAGVLDPLLRVVQSSGLCNSNSKLTLLRNATWTLSNICRGKPLPPFHAVQAALPCLAALLFLKDEEVLTDACWAFSYISDDTGNEKISEVIKCGAIPRLCHLLSHQNNSVKHPALRTIGNIVTGDDLQTQVVINNRALPRLLGLLANEKKAIRKEACWTISNITAGNVEQIEAVIENNMIQPLTALLRTGEFDVKKEAAWAISNLTSGGNDAQIKFLVHQQAIPPLCALFASTNSRIVLVALEGIENILRVGANEAQKTNGRNQYALYVEECGGVDQLELLQQMENVEVEIYEKAAHLVKKYFDGVHITTTNEENAGFEFNNNAATEEQKFAF